MMKKPMTLEDYRKARLIVAVRPVRLQPEQRRRRRGDRDLDASAPATCRQKPVLIKGFATHNNIKGWFADDHMVDDRGRSRAASPPMPWPGSGPTDVDTAQIYDCFTYMVLTQLEDYGFCKKGEGGAFVPSGALRMGGALPTNTSGGQLSEAHVEGMLQIVEGARQLQGIYPAERQVTDAEIALSAATAATRSATPP